MRLKKKLSVLIAVVTILGMFSTLVSAAGPDTAASGDPEQGTVIESLEGAGSGYPDEADVRTADDESEPAAEAAQNTDIAEDADAGEEEAVSDGEVPAEDVSDPAEGEESVIAASSEEAAEDTPDEEPVLLREGEDFSPEGDLLSYRVLDDDKKTAAVTGGQSNMTKVVIPAEVTYEGVTYKVTEIAKKAFADYSAITEVDFSSASNLKVIREDAFAYTIKDNSVPERIPFLTFPASLETVEDGAFHCKPVVHFAIEANSLLTEIPDGFLAADGADGKVGTDTECTHIWDYVIKWFVELASPVSTPEELARACDCLQSIDLGADNSLERIGMGAFKNQSHLTDINFGNSAADLTIARGAFTGIGNGGLGVDRLLFPANLAVIESRAFDFAKIRNLVFADRCRLTEIPDGFMEISQEGNNGYPGQKDNYDRDSFVNDPAQIDANSLVAIDFGENNSLTAIGSGAFKNQSHLKSIDFGTPSASLTIRSGAFIGVGNNGYLYDQGVDKTLNEGIETLVFPANLSSIGDGAFDYSSVRNLIFSDNCKVSRLPTNFMGVCGVGNNGYPGMNSEKKFVKDSAQIAANRLETVDFGRNNSISVISSSVFRNQSHMTKIDFGTLTSGSLKIYSGAFIGVGNNGYLYQNGVDKTLNKGVEMLVFPAELDQLSSSFEYASIRNLVFSDGCHLTSIPGNFLGINGTGNNGHPGQDVDGNFVKDYSQLAANCLETIDLGRNNHFTSIYGAAFRNQSHVTKIDFGTSATGSSLSLSDTAFVGVGCNTYLYNNKADAKQSPGIETLTLPPHLSYMSSSVFNDSGVKNIVFSDGIRLTSLSSGTFQDLDVMTTLALGADCPLTEIKGGAFSKCDVLKIVDLRGSRITRINDALKQNPKLQYVYFPETLESVTWTNTNREGECPFYECGEVRALQFGSADPSGLTFTDNVFQFLNKAGIVYVPEETTDEAVEEYVAKLTAAGLVFGEDNWRIERGQIHIPAETSGVLLAKMTAKGKTALAISWTKVTGAEGYDIFIGSCSTDKKKAALKIAKTIEGNSTLSWTKKSLKKGDARRAYVKAWVMEFGEKKYVATSPSVHAFAGGSTKNYCNPGSLTVKKTKVSLKKGKTFKIAATVKPLVKSKKLMPKSHDPVLRYLSSDKKVATVSSAGKITAKGKGTCKIYVYTQNGIRKTVSVTVK